MNVMQENRRKLSFLLSIKIEPFVEDFNIASITIMKFQACLPSRKLSEQKLFLLLSSTSWLNPEPSTMIRTLDILKTRKVAKSG